MCAERLSPFNGSSSECVCWCATSTSRRRRAMATKRSATCRSRGHALPRYCSALASSGSRLPALSVGDARPKRH